MHAVGGLTPYINLTIKAMDSRRLSKHTFMKNQMQPQESPPVDIYRFLNVKTPTLDVTPVPISAASRCRQNSTVPLYARLADELKRQIMIGIFLPGQKLPSVRLLSQTKKLSVNTVQEAYRVLEDDEWIVVKAQSGAYVARTLPTLTKPPSNQPLVIRSLTGADPAALLTYREDLLPLGAAVPDDSFFPCRRLASSISNLLRATPSILGTYNFAPGSIELRQQIARRVTDWDAQVDPQRITITNGAVEAVQLCLRAVTKPGDTVVVEAPCYFGFLQILESLGLNALPIEVKPHHGMDLDVLASVVSRERVSAILLSTTVSNPSGYSMTLTDKKRLVSIARATQIPIIEDATFADLHYLGDSQAAQGFDDCGLVMLCASLTKNIAPGLRIGWVDGGRFSDKITYLKRISSVGQPKLIELALADYMSTGGMAKQLRHLRRAMHAQVVGAAEEVSRFFPTGSTYQIPSGGFLLWVELPWEIDSIKLQGFVKDTGISVAPGTLFSNDGSYRNFIRLNCGGHYNERSKDTMRSLGEFIKKHEHS